jgi:hypothetical protein
MHHGGQKRLPTLRFISCPSLKNLIDKTAPLIQAGRFDNIVDLLSLVSDNISFIDKAALQKTTKVAKEIMALGWTGGNVVRMANAQTEESPSHFPIYQSLAVLPLATSTTKQYLCIQSSTY